MRKLFGLALILLFPSFCFPSTAGTRHSIFTGTEDYDADWQTSDGTTTVRAPSTVIVPNGTLSGTNYQTATFTPGTGTVTGITADSGGTTTGATVTLSGAAPISTSRALNTVTITIPAATSLANGYLTSTDWTTFNNKQAALTFPLSNANGGTGTGTAFTAGSVVFAGASGVYSQDNSKFFWDDTNFRLGIGTASPGAPLHLNTASGNTALFIDGSATGSPFIDFRQNNVEKAYIQYNNTGYLDLNSGGSMVIKSGSVGIGVTAPSAALHLLAGTAAASSAPLKFNSGTLMTTAEAGAVEFLTDAFYGTITTGAARKTFAFLESPVFTGVVTLPTPFTLGATSVTTTGTQLNYLNGATGTTGNATTNVVFSTAPTFTTSITDPLVIGGTGLGSTLTLRSTTAIGSGPNAILLQTGSNGSAEGIRVINSGRVGIGGVTTPAAALDVNGNLYTINTGGFLANNGQCGMVVRTAGNLDFYNGNAVQMSVDTTGKVGIGTAPSQNLHIAASGVEVRIQDTAASAGPFLSFGNSANTRLGYVGFGAAGSADMYLEADLGGGVGIAVNGSGTRVLYANSSGNVGIGTTSQTTLFSVAEKLQVNSSGLIPKYNNIATVSNGVPSELATVDSTGQTANIGATTLYAVPSTGAGMYRVNCLIVETTAASVSSTLPNAQIVYTDNETGGSITIDATPILGVAGIGQTGALTANTAGTTVTGVIVVNAKASTNIQYTTVNYASTAAGMAYAIHIKLEAL